MKKKLSLLLALACLMSLLAGTVSAGDDLDSVFETALSELDQSYRLDAGYMVHAMNQLFYSWEEAEKNHYAPKTVSAIEYEQELFRRFNPDRETLEQIRKKAKYNAADSVYTVSFDRNHAEGLPERQYLGYVPGEKTYTVYFQHVTYEYLPDDKALWDKIEAQGYPAEVEYQGKTFRFHSGSYHRIATRDKFGNQYQVAWDGEAVKILSRGEFNASTLPDRFGKDAKIQYNIGKDSGISFRENKAFLPGTTVTAEISTKKEILAAAAEAMKSAAEKYVLYEFSASLDGKNVQPGSAVSVDFRLPQGFGSHAAVYAMDEQGRLTEVETALNAADGTINALLPRFGFFLLADLDSKPAETEPSQPETLPGGETLAPTGPDASAEASDPDNTQEPPAGKSHMLLVVLLILIVLLSVALVLMLRKKKY